MITVHTMPNAGTSPALPTPAPVRGWAVDPDGQSAVVINPAATDGERMAWAFGQLQQLNVLLEILACRDDSMTEGSLLAGAIRHFTQQAECVLAEPRPEGNAHG